MQPHLIPRDTKGEGRILYIFSTKALIYTAVAIAIGFLFFKFFDIIGLRTIGVIIMFILALIGFAIATCKIPESSTLKITRDAGGEKIDDIIWKTIMFKIKNKNKIYVYKEGGKNNDK